MTAKPPRPFPIAPLQRVKARRITDPAELAALDEMFRKAREQAASEVGARAVRTPGDEAESEPAPTLDDLSEHQLLLLGQLVIERLPPAELGKLHQRLREKLGGP